MKRGGTNWDTKVPCSSRLFRSLVPIPPLIFFQSFFFCSLSSGPDYKNSAIMLQTWSAEQITFSGGECGDRTSWEAGKDSHWVTKRKRMREQLQGEWKPIAAWKETIAGWGGMEEKKRRAWVKRWQLTEDRRCNNSPKAQKGGYGEGMFRTSLKEEKSKHSNRNNNNDNMNITSVNSSFRNYINIKNE